MTDINSSVRQARGRRIRTALIPINTCDGVCEEIPPVHGHRGPNVEPNMEDGWMHALMQKCLALALFLLATPAVADEEIDQITAFLRSLTGEQPQVTYPLLPPSIAGTPLPKP